MQNNIRSSSGQTANQWSLTDRDYEPAHNRAFRCPKRRSRDTRKMGVAASVQITTCCASPRRSSAYRPSTCCRLTSCSSLFSSSHLGIGIHRTIGLHGFLGPVVWAEATETLPTRAGQHAAISRFLILVSCWSKRTGEMKSEVFSYAYLLTK